MTTTTLTIVPGLSTTLTVPAGSKLYISTDGGVAPTSQTDGTTAVVDVVIAIDGQLVANAGFQRMVASNRAVTNAGVTTVVGMVYWSMSISAQLTQGTHTIAVAAGLSPGSTGAAISANSATVSGNNTSVLQGQLTVIIVKQ